MKIWLACQCGGGAGRVGDIGYVHVVLWLAGWMTININSAKEDKDAFLAQMAERLPSKQKVASSILAEGISCLKLT
ncbi:hypothetical protein G6F22_017357 [Rhizopus arrhizus]|nr:hypothetical protein G6F22_017357 [Rhizopus arrhizus]